MINCECQNLLFPYKLIQLKSVIASCGFLFFKPWVNLMVNFRRELTIFGCQINPVTTSRTIGLAESMAKKE